MCEPTTATLATIAIASSVVGTGVAAYGAYQQSSAQKNQFKYQAAVSRNNSILAERAAKAAENKGDLEERQYRNKVAQVMGTQRSALAANGIDIADGTSALNILTDTAKAGELDALTIRNNAANTAQSYRNQGANFTNDAALSELSAKNTTPWFSAGTTLLQGAAQTGGAYADLKSSGAFNQKSNVWMNPDYA